MPARTLPWRLQIPFVQNSVFLWKRESMRARARARESVKKKSKELVSRRTHYRGSGNKGIRSQLCHFMRVMHKARSTPLSTHFLLFESALFAFLLTFSRAHARCFPRAKPIIWSRFGFQRQHDPVIPFLNCEETGAKLGPPLRKTGNEPRG